MSDSISATSCASHPDRTAVAICARCGKSVCELCRVEFVATEQTFCSERCRDDRPVESGREPVSNATLEAGLQKPIRAGWALAANSAGRIALHLLPVAVVLGLIVGYLNRVADGSVPPPGTAGVPILLFLFLFCGAFGAALVGVILSARHAGLEAAPYTAVPRRFVPWLATWLLMIGITVIGVFALILPGIYLSLRLFWADEFALLHNKGPIGALRASWELTRNQAAEVFFFQFILGLAQYVVLIPVMIVLTALIAGLEAIGWSNPEYSTGIEVFILYLVGFVVYGAMHGPEIVQFYGMRAARSNREAGVAPIAARRSKRLFAVVAALATTFVVGIIAAIAIPNLLNAVDRGKGKRTIRDSRDIAFAITAFAAANDQYPQVGNIEELERQLVPDYIKAIPRLDGWGHPFRVVSTPTEYEIRSPGKDGIFEELPPRGRTVNFDDDIVWRDGEMVQWPQHFESQ